MGRKILRIPEGQESLPFRRGAQRGLLSHASVMERRVLFAIGFALIGLAALYSYFVMTSVIHVANRGELSRKTAQLSATVAHLETAYLAGSDAVTESYAKNLGYVSPSDKVFVEKKPVVTFQDAR